jgi:GNAT superfamily N-acetyltransferase
MSLMLLVLDGTEAVSVSVRTFERDDEPAALDVLRGSFGTWPRGIGGVSPAEFFRWKHYECPFGPSMLLVAEADGKIVGFQGRMQWRLTSGAGVLETMRGADLAVHPAYRGHGVSLAIRRAARFAPQIAFTWSNPNRQSKPGSSKFGRMEVAAAPRYIRVHRWPARFSRPRPRPVVGSPSATTVLADSERIAHLLGEQPRDPRLRTKRSVEYLRWRYGHLPGYHAVATDAGLAIFRVKPHRSLWFADVCEILTATRSPNEATGLLRRVRQAAEVNLTRCCFPSQRDAARCGFMRWPSHDVLMVTTLHPGLSPDPTTRAAWSLSRGDLELI